MGELLHLNLENMQYFEIHKSITQLISLILKKTYIPVIEIQSFSQKLKNLQIIELVHCYSKPFYLEFINHPNLQSLKVVESEYRIVLCNLPKLRYLELDDSIHVTLYNGIKEELVIRKFMNHFDMNGLDFLYSTCSPITSKDFNYSLYPTGGEADFQYCRHLRNLSLREKKLNPFILKNSPI